MLLIVNPTATTMSDRLQQLVIYALKAHYKVRCVHTNHKGHAIELCQDALKAGDIDLVTAYGGDGTANEAANRLAGTDIPLCILPGGRTNVFCKMLGLSGDIVEATKHLLTRTKDPVVKSVDLGIVNGRYFTFSAGAGLDAIVVGTIDERPKLKKRYGPAIFAGRVVTVVARKYAFRKPQMIVRSGDEEIMASSVCVQNAYPYTYIADYPLGLIRGSTLTSAGFSAVALQRGTPLDFLSIVPRMMIGRLEVSNHRYVHGFRNIQDLEISTADPAQLLPLHVDGDYIGEFERAKFEVAPRILKVMV